MIFQNADIKLPGNGRRVIRKPAARAVRIHDERDVPDSGTGRRDR